MKLAALLLLVACQDGKPLQEHADVEKVADSGGNIAEWMPKDAGKAWEGAWLLRLTPDGPIVGVNIAGDKATIFDGGDEKSVAFSIVQPCAVAIGANEIQFLVRDGKVVSGHGAAGMREGDKAIVCGDGHDPGAPEEGVYLVTGNHCKTWKRDKGVWGFRAGVCVWANARGDDLLDVGTEHYSSTVIVKGDFLEERYFTTSSAEHRRATTWDAAKVEVTANMPEVSALDHAKAAGGRVGDMTTIAGIHATYANNKGPLIGVDLEVRGKLVETSTQTIRGKVTSTQATIADPDNPKAMPLICQVDGTVTSVKQGDSVVAKGRIDTRHDYARLRRCTITKAP